MDLYFAYLSTYSQKVLLALYEKDIPFTGHLVDLTSEEDRAEYRNIYPMGKVPLLIRDDGRLIPESSIIVEALELDFPQGPTLIPSNPEQARRVRFMDRRCDLYLNDPVVSLIFESWKPEAQRDAAMMAKASEKIGIMYRFMDDQLAESEYLGGGEFSLADCSAIPVLFYANSFAPFAECKNISRYWEQVSKRPAYLKLKTEAEPYVKAAMG